MSLLYRSGAASVSGQVVVVNDPFASWAEATAELEVACVVYVTPNAPLAAKEAIQNIERTSLSS